MIITKEMVGMTIEEATAIPQEEVKQEVVDKDSVPCTCHICEAERLKRLAAREVKDGN